MSYIFRAPRDFKSPLSPSARIYFRSPANMRRLMVDLTQMEEKRRFNEKQKIQETFARLRAGANLNVPAAVFAEKLELSKGDHVIIIWQGTNFQHQYGTVVEADSAYLCANMVTVFVRGMGNVRIPTDNLALNTTQSASFYGVREAFEKANKATKKAAAKKAEEKKAIDREQTTSSASRKLIDIESIAADIAEADGNTKKAADIEEANRAVDSKEAISNYLHCVYKKCYETISKIC